MSDNRVYVNGPTECHGYQATKGQSVPLWQVYGEPNPTEAVDDVAV